MGEAAVVSPSLATSAPLVELGTLPRLGEYVRSLWARRDFVWVMAQGDLKSRNMDTALGGVWHLLNPVLMVAVYWFIFGKILNTTRGIDPDLFLPYLVIGVTLFHFTTKCLLSGARSIVANTGLITSIYFPRAVLPLAVVLAETLAQVPVIVATFGLLLIEGIPVRATWLLIVPITILQVIFNLGIAFVSARLSAHFLDIQNLLPYVTRIWFYASGIFFQPDRIEGWPGTILRLNPLYGLIKLARLALIDGVTNANLWLFCTVWCVPILFLGFWYFRAYEAEYGSG